MSDGAGRSDASKERGAEDAVPVGALLREARERMGLELGALAASLHLDKHVVLALEEGRHDELPAQTYVRGYVRAYARLVGADADQMAALVDAAAVERPSRAVVLPPPERPSLATRAQRHLGWLFGGIVAVVVVAAAVVLWTVAPSFDLDLELPWPDFLRGETDPASLPPAQPVPTPTTVAEPARQETPAPSGIPAPADIASPAIGDVESAAAAVAPAPPTLDTLVFRFEEDSWVEVRDVAGGLIHGDLGVAGDAVTVQGKAPFDILIGYARGVQLEFNNDAVALAAHTRENVARLVVGQ